MNNARKCHEAGSKRVESRVESGTNQARKWYKPGSKMERTRLEIGTNQARKWHKPGSNQARTRFENGTNKARKWHEPGTKKARKILQFVNFRLEAGHAKWLELRHDRRIDVTQMTGNSVRKARYLNKQRLVLPKILVIGQGTKILQPKISRGWQIDPLPHLCLLGLIFISN